MIRIRRKKRRCARRNVSERDTGLEFMLAYRAMTADLEPKKKTGNVEKKKKQHLKVRDVINNEIAFRDSPRSKSFAEPLGVPMPMTKNKPLLLTAAKS